MARVTARRAPGLYVQLIQPRRGDPFPIFTLWERTPPVVDGVYNVTNVAGLRFNVSEAVPLAAAWFYSAPTTTGLPTRVGVWTDAGTLTVDNQTPQWSGAAASGWVRAPFPTRPTLQPGWYRIGAYRTPAAPWLAYTDSYWPGPLIQSGPLSTGGVGNFGVATAGWAFPATTYSVNYLVDVEVGGPPPPPPPPSFTFWNQAPPTTLEPTASADVTVALRFRADQAATLRVLWFYSPPTATVLPVTVWLWPDDGGTPVVQNASPQWSGPAGSGWVSTPLTATLTAGAWYRATVGRGDVAGPWYPSTTQFWPSSPALVAGPVSTTGGGANFGYYASGQVFPATASHRNYWVDVEVGEQ